MRWFLAGALILLSASLAQAQATGQVLSLGFNNHYRPDCWTPMLVQLTSQSPDAADYQIQVAQEDRDRDRVIFTQPVTLSGTAEGKPAVTENFWVYFRPKPTEGGLPDASNVGTTLAGLNANLKVFLCNKDGKQLSTLPLTSTIESVDPPHAAISDSTRDRMFVLMVSDGMDKPIIPNYSLLRGVQEDIDAEPVRTSDLPSNVIGYQCVDAIVWMNADANYLAAGTRTPALDAIEQWVRQGGHLIICQPPDPLKIKPFAEILPVGGLLNGQWAIPMVDRPQSEPLRQIFEPSGRPWLTDLGPFKMARVPALPGSKVDDWLQWTSGDKVTYTPWLARRGVGLGAVTWVAQDLGSPGLTDNIKVGWKFVWDHVLGFNNPLEVGEDYQPRSNDPWTPAQGVDIGHQTMGSVDLKNVASKLIAITGIFFGIYWFVACLGLYLYLLRKKRAHLSWFYFAAIALAATLFTVLIVKIVLRGPPELVHFSIIRDSITDDTGVIDSRVGLYIRQDGVQRIDLLNTAPHQVSYVAPLSENPQYISSDNAFPAYLQYQIPVRGPSDDDTVSVSIPYRSTSKKLQIHWVGPIKDTVHVPTGAPPVKLIPVSKFGSEAGIGGNLINETGSDLSDVYMFVKVPVPGTETDLSATDNKIVIYVPTWPMGATLKLDELTAAEFSFGDHHFPGGDSPAYGRMDFEFRRYWQKNGADPLMSGISQSLPIFTAFELMSPWRYEENLNTRVEFWRRGARSLDLATAIDAGQLVVSAIATVKTQSDASPLPISLNVNGSPVTGPGTTIMQFVIPVDRSLVALGPATPPPATQPSPKTH